MTKTTLDQVSLTPDPVPPGTSEQLFAVPGVKLGDFIDVNKPSSQIGLAVGSSRASANGQIGITFVNGTQAFITPTAKEVYTILDVSSDDCSDDCDSKSTKKYRDDD